MDQIPQCHCALQSGDRKSVRLLCRAQYSFQAEQVLHLPDSSQAVVFIAAWIECYSCLQMGLPMELHWVRLSQKVMSVKTVC